MYRIMRTLTAAAAAMVAGGAATDPGTLTFTKVYYDPGKKLRRVTGSSHKREAARRRRQIKRHILGVHSCANFGG